LHPCVDPAIVTKIYVNRPNAPIPIHNP
jgi:hypothetical protein